MTRALSMLVVLFLLFAGAAPTGAVPAASAAPAFQGDVPRFEPGACSFPDTPMLAQGLNLECGTLFVPEEHGTPNGETIELSVAIIRSAAADPDPVPVVMLQGGPGGSTIDLYLQLIPLNERLSSLNRDIILFDQRGTKYTEPSLFCEETYQLGIDLLNVDIPDEEADQRYQEALQACRDRLAAEGANLSAYDSLENAADVDALRRALGYEQVHLYGVSYGTMLAQHVLRNFPEGLASVTLDSVVALQTNSVADQPRVLNRGLEMLFEGCAADTACSRAFPNLREEFYALVDRLNENSASIQVTNYETGEVLPALLDGDTMIYVVIQMLYSTDLIPLIPRAIYQVRAGNYDVMETMLSNVAFDTSINYGMYYSVFCAEEVDFDPAQVTHEGLPPQLEALEGDSPREFLETCAAWDVEPLPAEAGQPVQSDVPVLVLSGAFDPVTPPEYGAQAAASLSNAYEYVFPMGGHGAVTSGVCQENIFIQFLNEPNQAPDASCIGEMAVRFNTPGALVDMPRVIDLLNPQGTNLVMLGLYLVGLLFLLTALVVYPIVWLVRVLRGNNRPAPADPTAVVDPYASLRPSEPAARPLLYRLAPWLAALTAIFLTAFIVILYVVAFQMAFANDNRILFGLPGTARPLFILPLLAIFFLLLMLFAAVLAWARGAGSVWGKLYLSLLTLAGNACVAVLMYFGAVQALFLG